MSDDKQTYIVLRSNVSPDKPFTHQCRHGVIFEADRCDLRSGAKLLLSGPTSPKEIAEATMDAIGYHAAVLRPHLERHGFAGYDSVELRILAHPADEKR